MTALQPIRREVIVDADPATAFEVFTARIGDWWPLADFSAHGAGSSVAFVDGVIVESHPDRPDHSWGTVDTWDPPAVAAFTWHPAADASTASHVTVTFTEVDDPGDLVRARTLVRIEHTGWEVFADPTSSRAEYGEGWPIVLDCFAAAVAPVAARSVADVVGKP